MPSNNLADRVAIVTGASKGIGAGIAKALAADGAAVVVNYASSRDGAEAVVAAIEAAGGRATAVGADVSTEAGATALVDAAIGAYGRLDVLVNNSGVYAFSPIEEVTEAEYRRIFDVNVLGVLLTTKAALRHLGRNGSVINISSVVSTVKPPGSVIYSGTKGAVDVITGVLANELGARGIRVNAINPGMVTTEGTQAGGFTGGEMERATVARTPLGRVGEPGDIGKVAAFLASDDAGWVTGETLFAGGGLR